MFGVDPEIAKQWLGDAPPEPEEFSVWPDNWSIVQMFMALQTQWRIHFGPGVAVYSGIDYAAIEATMRALKFPSRDRPTAFAGLMIMERAALPVLNSKGQK